MILCILAPRIGNSYLYLECGASFSYLLFSTRSLEQGLISFHRKLVAYWRCLRLWRCRKVVDAWDIVLTALRLKRYRDPSSRHTRKNLLVSHTVGRYPVNFQKVANSQNSQKRGLEEKKSTFLNVNKSLVKILKLGKILSLLKILLYFIFIFFVSLVLFARLC